MKEKIYLAGPLFSQADRNFLIFLRDELKKIPGLDVVWPGDLFEEAKLSELGPGAKDYIFQGCARELEKVHLVVALLDGPMVDDGTAWEIGFAFARKVRVLGLRTDFRNAGETAYSQVNCMIECACEKIFRTTTDLLEAIKRRPGPLSP